MLQFFSPSSRSISSPSKAKRSAGFTLVELLVVLVILGLLAALVAPRVLSYLGSSKTKTAKLQITSFADALDLYRLDNQGLADDGGRTEGTGRKASQRRGLEWSLSVAEQDSAGSLGQRLSICLSRSAWPV